MAKEDFKEFVKRNPKLINHVKNKEKTWQEFYELYDMYGEDENIWNNYLNKEKTKSSTDFMGILKNIDLDGLQESITSIQRVLGVVSDLAVKDNVVETKPLYEHLDD